MRETLPVPHVCIRQLFGPSDPPHLNWITHQGKCVPKIDRRDKNWAFGKLRAFFWSSDLHRKRTCNRLSTHVWSEPDITFNVWGSQSPKTAENQAFPKTNRVSLLWQPVISYSGKRKTNPDELTMTPHFCNLGKEHGVCPHTTNIFQ